MITYQVPLILSSSTENGAVNKNSQGSYFEINLDRGIEIPKKAKYCWIEVQSAEIWNTSPNILTGVNDKLYYEDAMGVFTMTIPQGLYSIDLLNLEISRQLVESGRDAESMVIFGNYATQKTYIQFLDIGTSIDFTQSDTFRVLLGFDSVTIGPSISTDEIFDSNNVAAFNSINYFILHTDLVAYGIRINNTYTQAVAQVLIDKPAGSQILHEPNNPPEISANELIGKYKRNIKVWLTDQSNNLIDTASEDFSMRLIIYYIM